MPIQRFPKRLHPMLLRVKKWALTDGPILVMLGVGVFLRGLSYTDLFPPLGDRHPAETFLPIDVWGIIWSIVGVLCLAGAWRPYSRLAKWALTLAVSLMTLWGFSYVGDSIADHDGRRWVQALNFLALAGIAMWAVWRGERQTTPKEALHVH